MTKMVEIKAMAIIKELAKLEARLERAEKALVKAEAKVEKLGCKWTYEEREEWLKTIEIVNGWIVNKEDVEKNGAFREWRSALYDIKDYKEQIEKAERRLEKAEEKVEIEKAKEAALEDAKAKEARWEAEFEEEQKEWAKDGIKLEKRYSGMTPKGKYFNILGNSGFSTRSMHCFTLYINYEVIFTSGEFWRAYAEIKKR